MGAWRTGDVIELDRIGIEVKLGPLYGYELPGAVKDAEFCGLQMVVEVEEYYRSISHHPAQRCGPLSAAQNPSFFDIENIDGARTSRRRGGSKPRVGTF